ncbi:MAG: outer membrane protein assembly factor BamE [Lentisphaerae bacterium]|nr:outer membrane protein assembly factor BamE [Lentisphaerota bacterium]
MRNRLIPILIAGPFVFCIAFAGCKSPNGSAGSPLSQASSQFQAKRAGCFRPQEASVLYPLIKVGMTKEGVQALLGKPDDHTALKSTEDRWNYTVGYSQAFTLEFEGTRLVKKSQVGLDME